MKINRILLGGIAIITLLFTAVCIIPSSKITETLVNEAAKIPQLAETLSSQSTQEESSSGNTPRSTVPVTSATQAEQAPLVSCDGTNATWLGTQDYGLICLDEERLACLYQRKYLAKFGLDQGYSDLWRWPGIYCEFLRA